MENNRFEKKELDKKEHKKFDIGAKILKWGSIATGVVLSSVVTAVVKNANKSSDNKS